MVFIEYNLADIKGNINNYLNYEIWFLVMFSQLIKISKTKRDEEEKIAL